MGVQRLSNLIVITVKKEVASSIDLQVSVKVFTNKTRRYPLIEKNTNFKYYIVMFHFEIDCIPLNSICFFF